MFARTVSAGAGASLLGEMRPPPSSAQCLRAASTAGALLAGYFPHLRGAFRFPSHLASLPVPGDGPLQCSTGQQHPQVASLLSTSRTDETFAGHTIQKVENGIDVESARTNVVATLMDKEYRPRIQRLEDTCLALRTSKLQSEFEAQRAVESSQKIRELNRRLCRELNDVRTERTAALEELERLKREVRTERTTARDQVERLKLEVDLVRKEMKQAQFENASLREALQDSQQKVLDLTLNRLESDACNDVSPQALDTELSSVMDSAVDAQDTSSTGLGSNLQEGNLNGDTVCRCHDDHSWGCHLHRVYSGTLLLAHRDAASRISSGPPGLELEAPPGLEFMHAGGGRQQSWSRLQLMPSQ